MFYKLILKPFFFSLDAEKAHHLSFKLTKLFFKLPFVKTITRSVFDLKNTKLEKELFGLTFKNPVGLAAGFDKDGKNIEELGCFGFGFIEVGSVTPKPQEGNDAPRIFRLPKDEAIINRMGFNNEGVEALVERLKKLKKTNIIIGGNIGKNKVTPNEEADRDYIYCFEALFNYVDYFVVNVSSPNTPGLRELQEKEPLMKLLNTLQERNNLKSSPKPILLKIAPDLTNEQLDDIVEIVNETKLAGLIATNTTISREGLKTSKSEVERMGAGGLSGKPLKQRSNEVITYLKTKSNNSFPIIGVGGINSPEDAIDKLNAGADLIQLYSGFIYSGPSFVKEINKAILK